MNNPNTSSTTLTSLVLLKQQIEDGKDYYDYLVLSEERMSHQEQTKYNSVINQLHLSYREALVDAICHEGG